MVTAITVLALSAACDGETPTPESSPRRTTTVQDKEEALFSRADLPKLTLSEAETPEGMDFQEEVAKYHTPENLFPQLRERMTELGATDSYETGFQAEGYTAEAPVQALLGQWYMYSAVIRFKDVDGADKSGDYTKEQHEKGAVPSVVDMRFASLKELGSDGYLGRWIQRYENGVTVPAVTFNWRIANAGISLTALGLEPGQNVKELDVAGLQELAVSLYEDNLELAED